MGDPENLDSKVVLESVADARARRIRTGLVALVVFLVWAVIAFWFVPRFIRGQMGLQWLRDQVVDPDVQPNVQAIAWTAYALLISAVMIAFAAAAVVMAPRIRSFRDLFTQSFSGLPAISRKDMVPLAITMGTISGVLQSIVNIVSLDLRNIPSGDVAVPEIFWAAPLMAMMAFCAIGVVCIALDALFGRWIPFFRSIVFPLYVCLTVAGVAIKMRLGLGNVAPWILSVGVAVAVTRAVSALQLSRFARRTAPWLAAALILYATSVPVTERVIERRALASLPPADSGAPNVLVVIWDAGRALSSSLYGSAVPTTPELVKLAARGVTFDFAFATAPWSLPSHGSIWTGRYPHEMNAGHRSALDDSIPTIGEVLSQHGYVSGGFIGNAFFGMPAFGLARGFSRYDAGPTINVNFILSSWSLSASILGSRNRARGKRRNPTLQTAEQIDDLLLDWVDKRGDRPFLAVVNHFDTHEPYYPPEPYRSAFAKKRARYWLREGFHEFPPDTLRDLKNSYEGAMAYLDHELGRLLDNLDRRGVLDNTVVIVTADHGEAFGEHNPGVVGHGITLFTPMLQVPMVIAYPPRVPGGRRRQEIVSLRDIPATIMDLVGVKEHPFPGTSLARYASGTLTPAEASSPRLAMVERAVREGEGPKWTAVYGDLFSVIGDGMQYIIDAEDKEHLYDLASDPWEQNNLADRETSKPVMARFRAILDSAVKGDDGRRRARLGETEFGIRGKKTQSRIHP